MKIAPIKTEAWAERHGFTHHGRLHGVPIWLSLPHGTTPHVCAKNWLCEVALDAGETVMATGVTMGVLEPAYVIQIGRRIGDRDE